MVVIHIINPYTVYSQVSSLSNKTGAIAPNIIQKNIKYLYSAEHFLIRLSDYCFK